MNVTVLGAGGRVGQHVVALCLDRGYAVTALVHSHNPFAAQAGLTVLTGDIYNHDDISRALAGSEAVISALGSWRTKRKDVLKSAMESVIPAMNAAGIKRIITVTGSGALWSGDRVRQIDRLGRLLLLVIAPKILRDGEAHIELLAQSGLDWTSVRSPVMTGSQQDSYALRARLPVGVTTIPRLAVATAVVDLLKNSDFSGQAPVIYKH